MRTLRRAAIEHGHDPSAVPHAGVRLARIGDTDENAGAIVRHHLPALLAGTRDYVRIDGSPPVRRDFAGCTERLIDVGAA